MRRQTLGILGVGHLAGFVLEGLKRSNAWLHVVLSPRNQQKAEAFSKRFGAEVARDNQAVVDQSDIVFISLPAASGQHILDTLEFREDQLVLSAMAGMKPDLFKSCVAPAKACCAMMPGYANALNIGPVLVYPGDPRCEGFLRHLGPVHVFKSIKAFETASTFGAFSGASFSLMEQIIRWFTTNGVPDDVARTLVAETLIGNGMVIRDAGEPLEAIIEGIATPGGITRQCVDVVEEAGGFDVWGQALDAVSVRMKQGVD